MTLADLGGNLLEADCDDNLTEADFVADLPEVDCGDVLTDADSALVDTCSFWLEGVILVRVNSKNMSADPFSYS